MVQLQEIQKKLNLRETQRETNYTALPKGYLFCGRYEIVKALEKGSGGCVYLVNDLKMMMPPKSPEKSISDSQKGLE